MTLRSSIFTGIALFSLGLLAAQTPTDGAGSGAPQNPAPEGVTGSQEAPGSTVIKTMVHVVVAPTTVTEHGGAYVNDLRPQDFRLYDNGKLQEVKVDVSFSPISLLVAIQANSGAEPALEKVKRLEGVFKFFITGDQGEVAIASFDHRYMLQQDFTSNPDDLTKALKKIRAGSSTSAMVDAVIDSVRLLAKRPNDHRKILLLISETRDKGSQASMREALNDAQVSNVIIYSVDMSRFLNAISRKPDYPRPPSIPTEARHMPAGVPATPTNVAQITGEPGYAMNFAPVIKEIMTQVKAIFVDNHAEVFTKYTGGTELGFTSQQDLENAISKIGAELHSQYLLSFNPSDKSEGGWHNLQVVVSRAGVKVHTRPGYWLAAVPY